MRDGSSTLHAQRWPLQGAVVAHPRAGRYLTHNSVWQGEQEIKRCSSFLPHLRDFYPQGKTSHHQISTYNRTNSSELYSHQVNEAIRGNLGWQNFMAPLSSATCSGEWWWLQNLLPFLYHLWNRHDKGPSAWGVTPAAALQATSPRGQPHWLSSDRSGKIPITLKKPIHLDRLLYCLECVQRNGRDYSESGFKWASFLVWSRCGFFWCHLTF